MSARRKVLTPAPPKKRSARRMESPLKKRSAPVRLDTRLSRRRSPR